MDESQAKRARYQASMERAALVVAIDRAGGTLTYTQSEYDAVGARFGGMRNLVIHEEVVKGEGAPVVRLTLARKSPGQGELPV